MGGADSARRTQRRGAHLRRARWGERRPRSSRLRRVVDCAPGRNGLGDRRLPSGQSLKGGCRDGSQGTEARDQNGREPELAQAGSDHAQLQSRHSRREGPTSSNRFPKQDGPPNMLHTTQEYMLDEVRRPALVDLDTAGRPEQRQPHLPRSRHDQQRALGIPTSASGG